MSTISRVRTLLVLFLACVASPLLTSCASIPPTITPPVATAEVTFRDHAVAGYDVDVKGIHQVQSGEEFLFGVMHVVQRDTPPSAGDFASIPGDKWSEMKDPWFGHPRATRSLTLPDAKGYLDVYMILWRLKKLNQEIKEFRYCGSLELKDGMVKKTPYFVALNNCP